MILQQVLKYIDNNLSSRSGTKVQITIDKNREILKIYIPSQSGISYDYILNFVKEVKEDDSKVFKSSVTSGFTGIDYKLDTEIVEDVYESIKGAIMVSDNKHLKSLESVISEIKVEDILEQSNIPEGE